ncbi:hypothetical protein Goklo_004437, partial [Gossypium klotzschianum]|nr:hypothetical protein [Gossypium klotzschianum]
MTVAESVVKFGLGKDKLGSSKSEERGVCEKDQMMAMASAIMVALVLSSSVRGVEANEVESEKKPVECFLCHGPHRLRKCSKKSVIKGDDGTDNEPKKLDSSTRKVEAIREKRSKKKRV